MMLTNLVGAVLATADELPSMKALYEYVLAGNGLFVRAADSRMEAMVPVAMAQLQGLVDVEPYARLKAPSIPTDWLKAILQSARKKMPREVLYQFKLAIEPDDVGGTRALWSCVRPQQATSAVSVDFADVADSVVDLHSHNSMGAFFSSTDNGDEQGLRFYAVIGRLDTDTPEISVRAGVYGHHWSVPADTVFETAGLFVDVGAIVPCPDDGDTDILEVMDALAEEMGVDVSEINPSVLPVYIHALGKRKQPA